MVQDFLPDVVGPVRGDRTDEKGLQFDVAVDEVFVHGDGGGGGGFAVEIAGGGEVVEGGFESDFVVRAENLGLAGDSRKWIFRERRAYAW